MAGSVSTYAQSHVADNFFHRRPHLLGVLPDSQSLVETDRVHRDLRRRSVADMSRALKSGVLVVRMRKATLCLGRVPWPCASAACGSATPGAADAADAAERTFAMAGSRSAALNLRYFPLLVVYKETTTRREPSCWCSVVNRHASHRPRLAEGALKPYDPFAFVYAGAELPFCSQNVNKQPLSATGSWIRQAWKTPKSLAPARVSDPRD